MTGGQVQAYPGRGFPHAAADLEQTAPEGIQLQGGLAPRLQPAAQGVEQPVGGRMQEQAELVGPEAVLGPRAI